MLTKSVLDITEWCQTISVYRLSSAADRFKGCIVFRQPYSLHY